MANKTLSNRESKATNKLPKSILIVGGGVFGLSTALALSRRHSGKITLLESSPTIPNPEGSSVDSSRIVRADYANPAYSRLAEDALKYWRNTEWGHEGRYNQNGLVFVSSGNNGYVQGSYENVKAANPSVVEKLPTRADVERVTPGYDIGPHVRSGYVNWASGWSNAEEGVRYAKKKLDEMGRVDFRTGEVKRLLTVPVPVSGNDNDKADAGNESDVDGTINDKDNNDNEQNKTKQKVIGVELIDTSTLKADLVILATGAWTGQLVDLRGRAEATGQVVSFIRVSDEEQARLADMPTLLNFSTGMFIIPPRNNMLKVARHAYGYRNPKQVPDPAQDAHANAHAHANGTIEVSLPEKGVCIPPEGEDACREELRLVLPAFADRPFVKTRICWYTDTPKGDFIISSHPSYDDLFLATGGSGHGYKFIPVIGDKIVDAIEGKLDPDLQKLWAWPENSITNDDNGGGDEGSPGVVWTEDGSRSGPKGVILMEEYAKQKRSVRQSRL